MLDNLRITRPQLVVPKTSGIQPTAPARRRPGIFLGDPSDIFAGTTKQSDIFSGTTEQSDMELDLELGSELSSEDERETAGPTQRPTMSEHTLTQTPQAQGKIQQPNAFASTGASNASVHFQPEKQQRRYPYTRCLHLRGDNSSR